MSFQLTGNEFEEIQKQFQKMDTDSDGKVTKEELKAYCLEQNDIRTDIQIEYMMRVVDLDNNGTIEFPEFLEMASFFGYNKQPYETQVKQMFKALDKNNDGYLYLEEIKHLWAIFTHENVDIPSDDEIAEIVENLDINGDGKIDYNEFLSQFDFEEINCM